MLFDFDINKIYNAIPSLSLWVIDGFVQRTDFSLKIGYKKHRYYCCQSFVNSQSWETGRIFTFAHEAELISHEVIVGLGWPDTANLTRRDEKWEDQISIIVRAISNGEAIDVLSC